MQFASASGGEASVFAAPSANNTASLRFFGSFPAITVNGGSARISSRVANASAAPLTVNASGGAALALTGPIVGGNGISLAGTSPNSESLSLVSAGGTGGPISVTQSTLNLSTVDDIGDGTINANSGRLTLGSFTFAAPPDRPPFLRNTIVSSGGGLILGDNRSFTLTGTITGGGGVTVAPTSLSAGTWTLSGANSFIGPITVNAAPGGGSILLNMLAVTRPAGLGNASLIALNGSGAAIGFLGDALPYTVPQPLLVNNGGTVYVGNNGGRADVTYAGAIGGTGGLTRDGDGVLSLAATNSFTGGLRIAGRGVTVASTDANLGASGASIAFAGGSLLFQPGFASSNRPIVAGVEGGTLIVNDAVTLTGPLTNNIAPGALAKAGLGQLTLTSAANSLTGVTIRSGGITAGGAAGRLVTANTGTIAILQGANLTLDNTAAAAARMASNAVIHLRGGTLSLAGNATANSSAVTSAALTLGAGIANGQGVSTIRLAPGAAANATARFASLSVTANNGAQLVFSGAGLGTSPLAAFSPGVANIEFNGAAPALTQGILPYATVENNGTRDLATYIAANGVAAATYQTSTINNASVALNALIGSDVAAAGASINAGKFTGGVVDLSAGSLTIRSGAVLITGPTTFAGGILGIGVGTNNAVEAPTTNFFAYADGTLTSRLANFVNNGGLESGIAKGGPAAVTLSNNLNSYSGSTRVLEGTLRLGANNVIPNTSSVVVAPGATFDTAGFSETIGSLNQVAPIADIGSYSTGTVIVGGTLITGGDNTTTAINLNVTGGGNFVKTGTGSMSVTGAQAFNGLLSIANGTLALGTHFSAGTGFANVSAINIGSTGINGEVTLRLRSGLKAFDRPIIAQAQSGRTATLAFDDDVAVAISSPILLFNERGLTIDAAGGPTIAGVISSNAVVPAASQLTVNSTGLTNIDSKHYSIRLAGTNTYAGVTTLAADATVWANAQAFGTSTSPIQLGSSTGDENPELSGDAGALALNRAITVQGSTSSVPAYAALGSRVAPGGGTVTYSGAVNIAGSRSKLVLFSNGEPLVVGGAISGAPAANLQIGLDFSDQDITTRGTVILSGTNNYAGGTALAAGTLGVASAGALGSGTLTIGIATIAPGHQPTLAVAGAAGSLQISQSINVPVDVTRDFRIATIGGGLGTVTFNRPVSLGAIPRWVSVDSNTTAVFAAVGAVSSSASGGLIKAGAGTVVLAQNTPIAGSLVIDEGSVLIDGNLVVNTLAFVGPASLLQLNSTSGATLLTGALAIDAANGGQLDVTSSGAIVDYAASSPISALTSLIISGRNGGAWNGAGINSSFAAALPGHAVGIAEASDLNASSFLGQSFVGDAVLMRYTFTGDNNLDGAVNLMDFALLAANFGQPGRWYTGDYNFNGTVEITDFAQLAANFNRALPANLPRGSAVPEPATALGLSLFGAIAMGARRPRKRRAAGFTSLREITA